MTSKILLAATLLLTACGNYSNEDLEFMNAVPAREDLDVDIPRASLLVNEAELSKLTHDTITTFNDALDFLVAADEIRGYQPTSRISNGRIWGPFAAKETGWQWRFVVTRAPDMPDVFNYRFELQPFGGGDTWILFLDGWFAASNGVRRGVGHFRIQTDPLSAAGFPVEVNVEKDEKLKELIVDYSTAAFPISVTMNMALYRNVSAGDPTDIATIRYHHEAEASGAGLMDFSGSDSMGRSFGIESRWMPTGRGRADATATDGVTGTWTQCWNDSFMETYNYTSWDLNMTRGEPADCPDFSTP